MYFIKRKKIAAYKSDVMGLDISNSILKCVVLRNLGISYQLTHFGVEANAITDEKNFVKTSTEIANSIDRMLVKGNIPIKKCILALPDTLVHSKWVRIDKSATENIEIAINLAVEEHIPYPLTAIYFDYQIFETLDQSYLNVFLVACRKEHLDVRLEAIYQSNLTPLFIEVNSNALQRAYTYLYSEHSGKFSLVIDIEMQHLTFLFLGEDKYIIRYSEAIVDFEQEIIKKAQGFIKLFYLSYPSIQLKKIFLAGSNLIILKNLAKKFNELCGIDVEIVGHNKILSLAAKLNEKKLDELFPSLFVSCGLALRGFMA